MVGIKKYIEMSDEFVQALQVKGELKNCVMIHKDDVVVYINTLLENEEMDTKSVRKLMQNLRYDSVHKDYAIFGSRFINNYLIENEVLIKLFPHLKYLVDALWRLIEPQFKHFTQYRLKETNRHKDNVYVSCWELYHHFKHLDKITYGDFIVLLRCYGIELIDYRDYTLQYYILQTKHTSLNFLIHEKQLELTMFKIEHFIKDAIRGMNEQKIINIQHKLQNKLMGENDD